MTLQRNIAYLEMMLRSDRESNRYYDLVRHVRFLDTDRGVPMINMGYWRGVSVDGAGALWEATQNLFQLVGETAELGPEDRAVLDAGCGFGTNAIYCMETFGPQRFVGLNTAGDQIATGRKILAEGPWGDRIALQHGSATSMPYADGAFDKVVSVEAAFHFPPRSAFFREAARVLRPGGLLTIADIVPGPPRSAFERVQLGLLRRAMQIPEQNVYGLDRYCEDLEDAGFTIEHAASIREHVFPQYPRWLLKHKMRRFTEVDVMFFAGNAPLFLYPWDYALIRARKSGRAAGPARERAAPRRGDARPHGGFPDA
jgi:cyclopropane fatty-acyl-phospholipid synthase-like methyltransferase